MDPAPSLPPAPERGLLRLAHLSDPHLTSLVGVSPLALRDKRVLGWLSWRKRRRFRHRPEMLARLVDAIRSAGVDHRVVTGDLTHLGLASELDEARDWLASLADAADTTLVPGNHDLYVADPDGAMHARWSPWMRGDDDGGFPFLRLRGPVALVGLDSAAPSPAGFASGRLGDARNSRPTMSARSFVASTPASPNPKANSNTSTRSRFWSPSCYPHRRPTSA